LWEEFKKFAVKGNVVDLAVGVVIGGAFGKIVTSLVNDIVIPLVGLLMGGVDFSDLQIPVGDASIRYGAFVQSVADFFIVSFSIFIFIRFINNFKRKKIEEEKPKDDPKPSREELLLMEIRDLLKQK